MENTTITVMTSSEKRNFGNIDTAVEYITHRMHENPSYEESLPSHLSDEIKAKLYKATGRLFTNKSLTRSQTEEIRKRIKALALRI